MVVKSFEVLEVQLCDESVRVDVRESSKVCAGEMERKEERAVSTTSLEAGAHNARPNGDSK